MDTNAGEQGVRGYAVVEARPTAVVVHCSDPRFQTAFAEFLRNELHLEPGRYIPLVISGGVGSLAEPLRLPKEFKFIKERIAMFVERFGSIERIVLINHEDCRHYESLKEFVGNAFLRHVPTLVERQRSDLLRVAAALPGILKPSLKIDVFFARFADPAHTRVVFESV
jgi:hypothetical protein